uniref:EDR1/CTR1/ARMC3-like peptidase-like domain-containing protein n=1 Tax=Glossina brevipalpis TaxID=37001 RepID=A0A1A9WP26_9MUSC
MLLYDYFALQYSVAAVVVRRRSFGGEEQSAILKKIIWIKSFDTIFLPQYIECKHTGYIEVEIDMSKSAKVPRRTQDRRKTSKEAFQSLTVNLETIESLLLLFDSEEEMVITSVLRHLIEFVRRSDSNVDTLREKNVLNALKCKDFYRQLESTMIKRLSLSLATAVIENASKLQELDRSEGLEIIEKSLLFYNYEKDDICLEYLTVMLNTCVDDPQGANVLLKDEEFIDKFFEVVSNTNNPDTELHSFQILEKFLCILGLNELKELFAKPSFPINRLLCDLTCEFIEIRIAALSVIELLMTDTSEKSPFALENPIILVLGQLTKMYCDNLMPNKLEKLIDVFAAAMRNEHMALLFFELNFFDRFLYHLNEDENVKNKCYSLMVIAEAAKYPRFLERLIQAQTTEKFLFCLIQVELAGTHVIMGLNRLIKSSDAVKKILETYDEGILPKHDTMNIKTREQAAEFLNQLLTVAYHGTASRVIELHLPDILASIFGQPSEWQSIDLYMTLLSIMENLAQNANYREQLCVSEVLTASIAKLLKNSFNTSNLVSNIFRTLCSLVEEETVRKTLLDNLISASIKRGLKSLANVVKISVTNFIIQTTRFEEFICEYVEEGVLEALVMHQKHSFCVPTWNAAIESILAKDATLKFCIRHYLGFNDTTVDHDFFVSKKKFEDFRDLQIILRDEVSPLAPILVVNFNRPQHDPDFFIRVPRYSETRDSICYCRRPADPFLPEYLKEINDTFELLGLAVNPSKMRRIDFENVAKRAKIIAELVARTLSNDLKILDLNSREECSQHTVICHLKALAREAHTTILPLGSVRSGCQFERALLFKALADQVGLPCTLQRSVDGHMLFNELALPLETEGDQECSLETLQFMPWSMLRPTHVIDLMYNVGDLYPVQSREALQYLKLY